MPFSNLKQRYKYFYQIIKSFQINKRGFKNYRLEMEQSYVSFLKLEFHYEALWNSNSKINRKIYCFYALCLMLIYSNGYRYAYNSFKKHVVKHKLNHVLTLNKYLSLQHSSAH